MDSIIQSLYLGDFEVEKLKKQTNSTDISRGLCCLLDELKAEKGFDYVEKLYRAICEDSLSEQTEAFAAGIRFGFRLQQELWRLR